MVAEPDPGAGPELRSPRALLLRQFLKFCVVGATSTSIDLGLFGVLRFHDVPRLAAQTIAFSVAVTNGFFWNRRWTFRATDPEQARRQYTQFYAVNIIGFLMNTTLLYFFAHLLVSAGVPKLRAELLGKLAAVPIVALWNFSASKFWAFAARVVLPSE